MFFHSVYLLQSSSTFVGLRRSFYIAFSAILLLLATMTIISNALMGQLMWIDHRNVPGGPAAYFAEHVTDWWQTLGSATSAVMNLMGDGLLVRVHISSHNCTLTIV